MKMLLRWGVCAALSWGSLGASPVEARRLEASWEAKVAEWNRRVQAATTDEERTKLAEEMPDANKAAADMWQLIGRSLDEEWTVEPAAWFLRTAHGLQKRGDNGAMAAAFGEECEMVREAVEAKHLNSPSLLPMCLALVAAPTPHSLAILEKVAGTHPDQKIQGVAAFGCALLLKQLGEDGEIMKRRLTHLRKAIIQSSNVDIGGRTVAEAAKSELYVITNLSKGREAPDLVGTDSAGRVLRLSELKGKVVYLLFWNAGMSERDRVLAMADDVRRKFDGRAFEVIGVNNDPLPVLRKLEAEGTVRWRSFSDPSGKLVSDYRIGAMPVVFVLDGQRRIQFSGLPGSFADLTVEGLLAEEGAPSE